MIKVWRTRDDVLRVELVEERGRQRYRVWSGGARVAECGSVPELAAALARQGVNVADLIED